MHASNQLLVGGECDSLGVTVRLGGQDAHAYRVHPEAYVWDGGAWKSFPLAGERTGESPWINGTAEGRVPFPTDGSPLHVIGAVCEKTTEGWDCGCGSAECEKTKWRLQTFTPDDSATVARTSDQNPLSLVAAPTEAQCAAIIDAFTREIQYNATLHDSFVTTTNLVTTQMHLARLRAEYSIRLLRNKQVAQVAKMQDPEAVSVHLTYADSSPLARTRLNTARTQFRSGLTAALNQYWDSGSALRGTTYTSIDTARQNYLTAGSAIIQSNNNRLSELLTWVRANNCSGTSVSDVNATVAFHHAQVEQGMAQNEANLLALHKATLKRTHTNRSAAVKVLNAAKARLTQQHVAKFSNSSDYLVHVGDAHTVTGSTGSDGRNEVEQAHIRDARTIANEVYADINRALAAYRSGNDADLAGHAVNAVAGFGDFLRAVSNEELTQAALTSTGGKFSFYSPVDQSVAVIDITRPGNEAFLHEVMRNAGIVAMEKTAEIIKQNPALAREFADLLLGVAPPVEKEIDLEDVRIFAENSELLAGGCLSNCAGAQTPTTDPNDDWVGDTNESWTCFDGETLVTMADGSVKPIKNVQVGDQVAAFDGFGPLASRRVTEVLVHDAPMALQVDGVIVTPEHRFLTPDGGYARIGELAAGDRIVRHDGSLHTIGSITEVSGNRKVYNLEVDGLHTFIAGGYRVHNRK
jgi:hypothetical protein